MYPNHTTWEMYFRLDVKSLQMFPTATKTDLGSIYDGDKMSQCNNKVHKTSDKTLITIRILQGESVSIRCIISVECDPKKSFLVILYPTLFDERNYLEHNFSARSNQGLVMEERHKIFPDGETEHFVSSCIFILSFTINNL